MAHQRHINPKTYHFSFDMKKNPLFKKLNGYQKAPKDRFLLLTNGVLTAEEFVVYELGLAITDWDRDHDDEIYGKFQATNKQIAEICGWKSDSQVSRIKKNLLNKGFFTKEGEQLKAKDFEKWQLRKTSAKPHELTAKIQPTAANMQDEVAKTQTLRNQNDDYSLSSYKVNLSLVRTDSEYRELVNSGQFGSMSVDDMRWIDENVKESAIVPS